MGTLKNIWIWTRWAIWRHSIRFVSPLIGLITVSFVLMLFFVILQHPGASKIAGGCMKVMIFSFILFFSVTCGFVEPNPTKNWRVAAEIGREMHEEEDFSDFGREAVKRLIGETEGTHDSKRLGTLIQNIRRRKEIGKEICLNEEKINELEQKNQDLQRERERLGRILLE